MTPRELAHILAAHQKWRNGEPGGERADLRDADLRGANLRRANLHGVDLHGVDLYGADLRRANLRGANLRGANLRRANLHDADLHGADLRDADLHGADLRDADLRGANLYRADLRRATLYRAKFAGCNLDSVSGIVWAAVGPTPEGRTVIAVWHGPEEGIIVHCGCGRNTPADALAACGDTSDPKRCRKLVKRVVKDVTAWVDGLETA